MTVISRDPTSVLSEIEFPNAIEGPSDPASPMPVTPDPGLERYERVPLNDLVDDRANENQYLQNKRDMESPGVPRHNVDPPARGNKIADASGIPDYSHLTVPDYSHLSPPEEDHPADQESPAPDLIKHATSMIQSMYEDIKKFSENPTPENAFKIAIQIVGGGVAAGPQRGTLGIAGGKPPYFRPPANENTPLRSPTVNPVTETELMSSQVVVQRMQQETQRLRQEAIKAGTIADKGSIVKEMESTLKRLQLDREAHETAGVLSKGDLRDLDKEIASVTEMLSIMKSKSGQVFPIDHKEMQATKPQEPQAKGSHLSDINKKMIQQLNDEGHDAKAIADTLTRYYTQQGVKITEDQIKGQIKRMGLITPQTRLEQAVRQEVIAQDIEVMGKARPQKEIFEAVETKYPGISRSTVDNILDRTRSVRRTEQAMAEKYGIDLKPKEMAQQQKASDSIFKPLGQGELDFYAIEKPRLPRPDLEQSKREMKFAQDTYAKFNQSIMKGSTPSKEVLEENRLRGLLYDRTKDLHTTVKQIEKDEKSGSLLGRHARDYLESRAQAYLEQIKDLKERIWGAGPSSSK